MALARLLKGETVVTEAEALIAQERNANYYIGPNAQGSAYESIGWNYYDKQGLDQLPFGSVAITPFTDAIMKYDQSCGPDGVMTKMRFMRMADNHVNIKAHLMKIDSGGGEAFAMLNTSDFVKTLNKPVVAFIDDFSASAAYGIATSASHIVANRDEAYVGSIGTVATVIDDREFFEQMGIKLTDVYADASVDKNGWYRAAMEGNMDPLKAELNKFNNKFLSLVETNRGSALTQGRAVWGTGKLFNADEALNIGLIDQIGSFDDTINSLINS